MVHFIQYSTFMHSMVQLTFFIIYKIYVKTVILATGYIFVVMLCIVLAALAAPLESPSESFHHLLKYLF